MSGLRKVCIITGTRADYGLLYWLMKEVLSSTTMKLQVVATGMHLSPEFGLTYQQIEEDGFFIDHKVEILLSSDSAVGISKSMGLGMIGFGEALAMLSPDLVVILGDRFEMLAAASAATVANIPIAHIHGGETTEGAFDEAFRHSITKMSHIHFTSTDTYRNRVIQLGEHPDKVHNVGAPGVDGIKKSPLLSRSEFEKSIDIQLDQRSLLVTFHPVTLENSTAAEQFEYLLQVLSEQISTSVIFTKANADTDGRIINKMIDEYVLKSQSRAISFMSLGRLRYLSAMQYVDGVIGNSSSGLVEAPSFKVGTVNIGDRQRGRIRANSVIDCEPTMESIRAALQTLFSTAFKAQLETVVSPYGDGDTAVQIAKIIDQIQLEGILKKTFHDQIIEKH